MKTAFFLSSFRAGGGERVMIRVANVLAERGHDVDIVVLKRVGEYESHVDSRIRIITLDAWRMIFSLPKLVGYFRRERPTTLIAVDEYAHLLALGARFISGAKCRIVLRVGNVYSELYARYTSLKMAMQLWLVRRFYRYADALIANSQGVADDVISLTTTDPKKVTVIYNPKPIEELRERATEATGHEWFDAKTVPIVLAVGRLREQKNFGVLMRAFTDATKDVPARLVIVGSGREEQRLKQLAHELGIEDRFALVGYADNPYAYMSKADVFVHTSLWEGLPNVLIEAMVCGLPVIAADCNSGPREILAPTTPHAKRLEQGAEDVDYGILTAVSDQEAIAASIKRMLTDDALRTKYMQASAHRAQDFAEAPLIDAYIRVMAVG